MTFAEAEKNIARLKIEENIYILKARALEEKAAEIRKLAVYYRERSQTLVEQQSKIWQEFNT